MPRRSITQTHERIAQLGWEADYHEPVVRYPTRYRFPHKAKDPMRHIMREYLPMELEKDERVYGGHDAAVRAGMTSKAHERWLEILKPFIVITNYAEVAAGRCMSMLMSAVPNNELRNGYHVQFVDEIRHTGMQMSLARWYAKNVPDPAGWNLGPKAFSGSVLTNPGLNMLSHFIVGDPIQCAFTLQVVAETAFTNVVFVATPDVAARNGDFTLPTTYPERPVRRGPAHLQRLRDAADRAAGRPQRAADRARPAAGVLDQPRLHRHLLGGGDRVLLQGPLRPRVVPGQVGPLGPRRLAPRLHHEARQARAGHPARHVRARPRADRQRLHHRHAILAFAGWPLSFWRFDPLDERDFEWFEASYPGWYAQYGAFWEAFRHGADPRNGFLPLDFINMAPPFCWTCQGLCVIEADRRCTGSSASARGSTARGVPVAGRVQPGPLHRRPQLPGPLPRVGGLGGDPRPRLRPRRRRDADRPAASGGRQRRRGRRWTLSDIRAHDLKLVSPNIRAARELGLPSGDWSDAPAPSGAVPLEHAAAVL